jgi:hypothetical protein
MDRPPEYYMGPVPYSFGYVELPEGIRLETLFHCEELDTLEVGLKVELDIDSLFHDDKGNEVFTYKFVPMEH